MKNTCYALATAVLLAAAANSNASVMAVEQGAFSGATVINFEDLASGTSITTQYAGLGVADFNATVLGAQGWAQAYNGYPAYSGSMEAFIGGSIAFTSPVDRVGAWIYKNNGQQYLTALDSSMNVLLTVAESSTSTDSALYDFVGIQSSSANIAYVVIANKDLSVSTSWDVGGPTTFFDDFTFGGQTQQAVAEPATLALFGLGLLGLAAARRKV